MEKRLRSQEHTFPHRAVQSLERFSCSQISLWHAMAIGSQALFLIFERSSQMLTHGIFHHILPILQITMQCFWVYPCLPIYTWSIWDWYWPDWTRQEHEFQEFYHHSWLRYWNEAAVLPFFREVPRGLSLDKVRRTLAIPHVYFKHLKHPSTH